MDGNGRWAQNRGLMRVDGHRAGLDSVKGIIQACLNKNIAILSLFAFSSENWARPQEEVECLMALFLQALNQEITQLHEKNIKLMFIGSREVLSLDLQEKMQQAEALTALNTKLTVNVAINYGGRWDIVQAARKIAVRVLEEKVLPASINEAMFAEMLDTQNLLEPDLFIRTSGEKRLSNFFLWQLAYTELYFTKTHWPDFNEQEFEKALISFAERERRYGKTSLQLSD